MIHPAIHSGLPKPDAEPPAPAPSPEPVPEPATPAKKAKRAAMGDVVVGPIEGGVAMPAARAAGTGLAAKTPFGALEPGQSVVVTGITASGARHAARMWMRTSGSTAGFKFVAVADGGIRILRK